MYAVKYEQLDFPLTLLYGASYLLTDLLLINIVFSLFGIELDKFSIFFYPSLYFCLCIAMNICILGYSNYIYISIC